MTGLDPVALEPIEADAVADALGAAAVRVAVCNTVRPAFEPANYLSPPNGCQARAHPA